MLVVTIKKMKWSFTPEHSDEMGKFKWKVAETISASSSKLGFNSQKSGPLASRENLQDGNQEEEGEEQREGAGRPVSASNQCCRLSSACIFRWLYLFQLNSKYTPTCLATSVHVSGDKESLLENKTLPSSGNPRWNRGSVVFALDGVSLLPCFLCCCWTCCWRRRVV